MNRIITVKFLEIGLGCTMYYGAGQSVKIWRELLQVEFDSVWEADYDIHCVEKNENHVSLQGIHLLAGDQSDFKVLDEWIKKSGGEFDIVIDDGSHRQHMIYNSFVKLWPQVVSGGVYFIEDLQVAYRDDYADTSGRGINMIEVIQAWMEQLVLTPENIQKKDYPEEKRLPKDIRMFSCQAHACVILKCFKNPGIGDLSYCS